MEHFNNDYVLERGLMKTLKIVGFLFLAYLIIHGLFILIPAAVLIYAVYRGTKFVKSKFERLKNRKNIEAEPFEIYKDGSDYVNNSEIIDVEYEEIK